MSGWWFSPAQLVGNSGLCLPTASTKDFASTEPLTLSPYLPFLRKHEANIPLETCCRFFFFFPFWLWSRGKEEGKRTNFL